MRKTYKINVVWINNQKPEKVAPLEKVLAMPFQFCENAANLVDYLNANYRELGIEGAHFAISEVLQ